MRRAIWCVFVMLAIMAPFSALEISTNAATAPPAAAQFVKVSLKANGADDRLVVAARVATARPRISCTGVVSQRGAIQRLPRLRTGAKGGAQWRWAMGDASPRGRLSVVVRCAFPNAKHRRARNSLVIGPGPHQAGASVHLIRPGTIRRQPWIPDKTSDGAGGVADLYPPGQCTWYVAKRRPDLPYFPGRSGDAMNWIASAKARGLRTGATPKIGAVAVFAPGVYGAGEYGHVAYVTAVRNLDITVAEANGPTGRVGAHRTIPFDGLQFIYRTVTRPPPASSVPTVSVSKGPAYGPPPGGLLTVVFINFPGGTHTITCRADGYEGGFWTYTRPGIANVSSVCFYGFHGGTVWVTVDGVISNKITW